MSDIDNVSWNYPTPIWFGLGRSLEIPNALEAQGMQNPLVVTDPEFTSNKNFLKTFPVGFMISANINDFLLQHNGTITIP